MSLVYTVKEADGGCIRTIVKRLVRKKYCLHCVAKVVQTERITKEKYIDLRLFTQIIWIFRK